MDKEKLVKEYLNAIALRLSADYGLSFEVATRATEDLDLLNIYKDNYNFLLHEDISTWVDIAYQKYITEEFPDESGKVIRIAFEGPVKEENMKNKTIVKPLSYQLLVYDEQPTTKNTKIGDMVLYKSELWLNDGNMVAPMSLNNYINIDKYDTILKPLIKDQPDEKTLKENTMENYIVINGKKAELTEEQLKQLGLKVEEKKNNPFERRYGNKYYKILENGSIPCDIDSQFNVDNISYKNVNYFNDSDFANQVYLHELLNRKLLKYAWDNNAEDCEWDNQNPHYYIRRHLVSNLFYIQQNILSKNCGTIYFSAEEIAEQAIEDVVEPFIAEHPEFVW